MLHSILQLALPSTRSHYGPVVRVKCFLKIIVDLECDSVMRIDNCK